MRPSEVEAVLLGLSVAERVELLALLEKKDLAEQKAEAEDDFLAFVRMMWPVLEPGVRMAPGWILDVLADVLMATADGVLNRVCLNVPPGSCKSTLLNVMFPAWLWGPCNRPSARFLSISYSDVVPTRDNLRFAQTIKSDMYQSLWGDRFRLTIDNSEKVGNDKTGWKATCSTRGSTIGQRADFLCLDDLSNPANVESEDVRNNTTRFVREIMPSRLNDLEKSAIINLQQRTHQMDATGLLLEHSSQDYTFVCIPAEFDPLRICRFQLGCDENGEPVEWVDPRSLDENGNQLRGLTVNKRNEPIVIMGSPMAKAEGTSFWPERFPDEQLQKLKASMTQYAWSAQFNQIPGVRGGAIIRREWWKVWKEAEYPPLGTVIVSVDTAYEQNQTSDYNACTAWGAFAGDHGEPLFLLLEAWQERMPLAQLVRRVNDTCRVRKCDYLLIEHASRGRDLHDELMRLNSGAPWQTMLVRPNGDKASRLHAVSELFSGKVRRDPVTGIDVWEGGIVYAPDRDWCEQVIEQTSSFPYAAHDDLCDTVSQALAFARQNQLVLHKGEYDDDERERMKYRRRPPPPYMIKT